MYQRILVPIDGSPTAQRGLTEAIRLASLTHGRLRLVHVIDDLSFALSIDAYSGCVGDWLGDLRSAGNLLLMQAKTRAAAADVEAETILLEQLQGRTDDLICGEARSWPADLIVIGTHGRRGISRLVMGSDAERVLRKASVPVLLVPGGTGEGGMQPAATTSKSG